jgi:hypothetical protein
MITSFATGIPLQSKTIEQELGLKVKVTTVNKTNGKIGSKQSLSHEKTNGKTSHSDSKQNPEVKLLSSIITGEWQRVFEKKKAELEKFKNENTVLIEKGQSCFNSQWRGKSAEFANLFVLANHTLGQRHFNPKLACSKLLISTANSAKIIATELLVTLLLVYSSDFESKSFENGIALINVVVDSVNGENLKEEEASIFQACVETVSDLLAEVQLKASIESTLAMIHKSKASRRKVLNFETIEF